MHMSNQLSGIKGERKKIAEDIFHEIQGDNKQALFEVLKNELNNTSDVAIEIRTRQNKRDY